MAPITRSLSSTGTYWLVITLRLRYVPRLVPWKIRLTAKEGGVDLAFVQGGTNTSKDAQNLTSLGSVYYEPLWVFYRGGHHLNRIGDLAGKRIAVGEGGSGTRVVALQLLRDNGIQGPPTVLSSLGALDAANALLGGSLDAALVIASPRSAVVQKLLMADGIKLMSFERAEAYTRIHRYLSLVTLPEGVIDLQRIIPPTHTTLIAATANLVARSDLHPALVDLLLKAAQEVHGAGDLFERQDEFPSPKYLEFPLSDDAERFYKRGPSFLRRYLPFWAATFVERMVVLLIPIVALLWPLFRIIPPMYRWRVRSRIYRWYEDVKAVDLKADRDRSPERLATHMAELDRIEDQVNRISTPLPYADQLYDLRMHINLVRGKLERAMQNVTS
ncbi:MAG: ABC transporter substrate-binding protein [candidate division NC10 bacterium]|nr:ABC transporter substrate-binding protein [candidate division NC10 bacterium]